MKHHFRAKHIVK